MTLSVLTIRIGNNSHGLYDCENKKFIATGSYDDMFTLKHNLEMEESESEKMNYENALLQSRVDLLISSGQTKEEAIAFINKYYKGK